MNTQIMLRELTPREESFWQSTPGEKVFVRLMLIRSRDLKKLYKKVENKGHRKEAINLCLPQIKHPKLHLL